MSDDSFGYTKADVSKLMQQESKKHAGGDIPADSQAAQLQSIVDSNSKDKDALIAERQANLPLPNQPPVPSDWQSADASVVNVGSGMRQDDVTASLSGDTTGLRGPATAESAVRTDGEELGIPTAGINVGREAKDDLEGLPSDALSSGRGAPNVTETRNE